MSTAAFSPFFKFASRTFAHSSGSSSARRIVLSGSLAAALTTAAWAYDDNRRGNNNNSNNSNHLLSKAFLGGLFGSKEYEKNTREASKDVKPFEYYQKVYNDIAIKIREHDEWDDGSYGPILVRYAWHNSGSYSQHDHAQTKGGSYSGTMRFAKEQHDPENAGLPGAENFLKSIKEKYPDLSTGDLNTLGGVVGIQEMDGPKISWRPGRKDLGQEAIPPYHRLPDASQTSADYVRSVFNDRLGFSDEEMVALIGVGHSIGRCHTTSSGFDGPWTFSPTVVTNEFFKLLLDEDWDWRKWSGKKQYEDVKTKSLMALPTDMTLKTDPKFRKYSEIFAKDSDRCMTVFASAFSRLLERGISFPSSTKPMIFQTLDEQHIGEEDEE